MSDTSARERWERAARDTRRWRHDAEGLKAAADLLRDNWLEEPVHSRVAFPALLLAGYAVELLAKARILDAGGTVRTWRGGRGHDLPWLVDQAGVPVSPTEAEVLQRTSHIIRWAGRYPTPKEPEDYRPEGEPSPQQVHETDFWHIDAICERLT